MSTKLQKFRAIQQLFNEARVEVGEILGTQLSNRDYFAILARMGALAADVVGVMVEGKK